VTGSRLSSPALSALQAVSPGARLLYSGCRWYCEKTISNVCTSTSNVGGLACVVPPSNPLLLCVGANACYLYYASRPTRRRGLKLIQRLVAKQKSRVKDT
jgi:hypothetical protein